MTEKITRDDLLADLQSFKEPQIDDNPQDITREDLLADLQVMPDDDDQPSKETSIGKEFLSGLKAGAAQTEALVTDAAPAMFFDLIGNKERSAENLKDYQTRLQEIEKMYPRGFESEEGVRKFALLSSHMLGQGLTSLGVSIVGGVGGMVLGGPIGAAAGALGTSYLLNSPESYTNLIEAGAENPDTWALGVGALKTGLDFLPLGKLYGKTFGKAAKDVLTSKFLSRAGFKEASDIVGARAVEQFALEGVTEAAQEAADIAAEELLGDMPADFFTKENMYRVALAGYGGALVGGVAGGAGGIYNVAKADVQTSPADISDAKAFAMEHELTFADVVAEIPEEAILSNRIIKTEEEADEALKNIFNIDPKDVPQGQKLNIVNSELTKTISEPKIPNLKRHAELMNTAAVEVGVMPMIDNNVLESVQSVSDLQAVADLTKPALNVRLQKLTKDPSVYYRGVYKSLDYTPNGLGWFSKNPERANIYSTKGRRGAPLPEGVGSPRTIPARLKFEKPVDFGRADKMVMKPNEVVQFMETQSNTEPANYKEAKNEFLKMNDGEVKELYNYWMTDPGRVFKNMTEAMGFDAVKVLEGGDETIGVLNPETQAVSPFSTEIPNQHLYADPLATPVAENKPIWDLNMDTLKGVALTDTDLADPVVARKIDTIANTVKSVAGDKVKVEFVKDLTSFADGVVNPVRGAQVGNTIYLAMKATDPTVEVANLETAYHELWHVMYDERMGVFTDKERQIIESQYPIMVKYLKENFGVLEQDIKALYNDEVGKVEVIATLFGNYATTKGNIQNKIPQTLKPFFSKVVRLIQALGRGLRGQGYGTFESIMDRTQEGSMSPEQAIKQAVHDNRVARLQKMSNNIAEDLRKTTEDIQYDALLEDALKDMDLKSDQYYGIKEKMKFGLAGFLTSTMRAHLNPIFAAIDNIRKAEETDVSVNLTEMQTRGEPYYRLEQDQRAYAGSILRELSVTKQPFTINEKGHLEFQRGGRTVRIENPAMVNAIKSLRYMMQYPLEQIDLQFRKRLDVLVDNGGKLAAGTVLNKINPMITELNKKKKLTESEKAKLADLEEAKTIAKHRQSLKKMLTKSTYYPETRFGKYAVLVRRKEDITPTGRTKEDADPVYFGKIEEGRHLGKYNKFQYESEMSAIEQYKNDPAYKVEIFTPTREQYYDILSQSISSLDAMANLLGSAVTSEDYRKSVEEISEKIRTKGFGKRFLDRKNIPGASKDYIRIADSYVSSSAHYLARERHANKYKLIENQAKNKLANTEKGDVMFKEIQDQIAYLRDPVQEYQKFTTFNFLWTMGFNLSSAALQYMTLPIYTLGTITQFNPNPIKNMATIAKATKDIHKSLTNKNEGDAKVFTYKNGLFLIKLNSKEFLNNPNFTADEKEFFKWFYDSVHSGDLFIEEMLGVTRTDTRSRSGQLMSKWDIVKNHAGIPISVAEQLTRASTALSAYRTLRDNPDTSMLANSMLGVNSKYPDQKWIAQRRTSTDPLLYDLTGFLVDDAHAVFDKRGRGRNYRGPGRLIFPFMQYPASMNELMVRMARRGPEGRRALATTLASLFLFAGALGMPGAELLKELYEAFHAAAKKENIDIEREFRIAMMEMTQNASVGKGLVHGLPRAALGLDIDARLRQPIAGQDVLLALMGVKGDATDLFGVQGSFASNLVAGLQEWSSGGTVSSVGTMLTPTSIANLFRASTYMEDGVMTRKGVRLMTPEEVKEAPFTNVFLRMLGVGSGRVADRREEQYWSNLVNQQYKPKLNSLRSRAANVAMRIADATEVGKLDKVQSLQKDYDKVLDDLYKFIDKNNLPYDVSSFHRSVYDKVSQRLEGGPLPKQYDRMMREQYFVNRAVTGRDDYFYGFGKDK